MNLQQTVVEVLLRAGKLLQARAIAKQIVCEARH